MAQKSAKQQLAHRFAGKGLQKLHLVLGIPTVIASTVAGSLVFASFDSFFHQDKMIVGLLDMSAAILAALQTFLHLDQQLAKHQRADSRFASIKHRIEQALNGSLAEECFLNIFIDHLRRDFGHVINEAPVVPEKYWKKARRVLRVRV
jgi:hypothetical protein